MGNVQSSNTIPIPLWQLMTLLMLPLFSGCCTNAVSKAAELEITPAAEEMEITPAVLERAEKACHGYDANGHSVSVLNVSKLLSDGFPVNHAVNSEGWTLLHCAVIYGDKPLIRLLLKNGASRMVCSKYNQRPVDIAYDNGQTAICKMLSLDSTTENVLIDGIPETILDEMFRFKKKMNSEKTLLSVNGKDPSSELLDWLIRKQINFGVGDFVEATNTISGHKEWLHKETKEKVTPCYVLIRKMSDVKYRCSITYRDSPQPLSFGFYTAYEAKKKFGYWFIRSTERFSM